MHTCNRGLSVGGGSDIVVDVELEGELTSRMLMRKSALQPRSRKTPTGGKIIAKLEKIKKKGSLIRNTGFWAIRGVFRRT